jgi:hypothetical protein
LVVEESFPDRFSSHGKPESGVASRGQPHYTEMAAFPPKHLLYEDPAPVLSPACAGHGRNDHLSLFPVDTELIFFLK